MATIDDIAERAARDLRADVRSATDVEAGLSAIVGGAGRSASPPPRRTWWAVGWTVTAAAVALVTVLAVRDDTAGQVVPATTPPTQPAPSAESTTPTSTVTSVSVAASCDEASLLAAVSALFPDEPKWNPTGVTIDDCRGGFAHVVAIADQSTCPTLGQECYENQPIWFQDVNGVWTYLAAGTGMSCSPGDTAPDIEAACAAFAATEVITRPYIDPKVCGDQAKSVASFQGNDWVPFAVAGPQSLPIQVFAQPTEGVAHPFAVVLRITDTLDRRTNDHPVMINGAEVSIDIVGNGNASAAWTLPDGTWAYLRARDLDQAAIVALVARLTPRDATAPIPGFDLAPSTAPGALELVAEHMNSGLTGTTTRLQCAPTPGSGIYRIDAITGDPTTVYVALMDRARVYAIGVNGDGAIAINGPDAEAIDLSMVVNADQATWDAIKTVDPIDA